jgi:hypothetical protein
LENQKLVAACNQLKQDSQHLMMDEYRFKKQNLLKVYSISIKNALSKSCLRTHFFKAVD